MCNHPLQKRLVIFRQLDLRLILGIQRRHDIDHLLVQPARASSKSIQYSFSPKSAGAARSPGGVMK